MKFQITPEAKQLILRQGGQITASIEKEECYACGGHAFLPYPAVRPGEPRDLPVGDYQVVVSDGVRIYVHKLLADFAESAVLTIDVSDGGKDALVITGTVPAD